MKKVWLPAWALLFLRSKSLILRRTLKPGSRTIARLIQTSVGQRSQRGCRGQKTSAEWCVNELSLSWPLDKPLCPRASRSLCRQTRDWQQPGSGQAGPGTMLEHSGASSLWNAVLVLLEHRPQPSVFSRHGLWGELCLLKKIGAAVVSHV